MTRRMCDAGADAVLVITPSFYKNAMNNDALYRHFYSVSTSHTLRRTHVQYHLYTVSDKIEPGITLADINI